MKKGSVLFILLALMFASSASAVVMDFEDAAPGVYTVGDSFVAGGVIVTCEDFVWSNDTVYSGGNASVGPGGMAGGSGHEVWFNSATLDFDFGGTVDGLSFQFGYGGGDFNLEINNMLVNVADIAFLGPMALIGGTQVFIGLNPANGMGAIFVIGAIDSFAVGGQEFAIDNLIASSVPEPATLLPLCIGGAFVVKGRRRRS